MTPWLTISKNLKHRALSVTYTTICWLGDPLSPTSTPLAPGHEELFFSPQKFTHLLTSTPKIGHKLYISTIYHPHPHVTHH